MKNAGVLTSDLSKAFQAGVLRGTGEGVCL